MRRSVCAQLRASTAVAGHVGRLQVDEVGRNFEGVVEVGALENAAGPRLEAEHGVPRIGLPETLEITSTVHGKQIGQLGVVGAVATFSRGVERVLRREMAGDGFHVVTEMHDSHGERNVGTSRAGRKAVSVPSLEGEAQCVADVVAHVESPHQHVAYFASGREVVDGPVVRSGFDRRDDLLLFLRRVPGGRVGEHVAHDLGRVRGVVHERLRADRDLVTEQGGDLVRVTRCNRCSAAARPSRPFRTVAHRSRRPRTSPTPAGTNAAATRVVGRRRCPAQARTSRRTRRAGGVDQKWGNLPMPGARRDAQDHRTHPEQEGERP